MVSVHYIQICCFLVKRCWLATGEYGSIISHTRNITLKRMYYFSPSSPVIAWTVTCYLAHLYNYSQHVQLASFCTETHSFCTHKCSTRGRFLLFPILLNHNFCIRWAHNGKVVMLFAQNLCLVGQKWLQLAFYVRILKYSLKLCSVVKSRGL